MLADALLKLKEAHLRGLITDPARVWHTLDVLYERPRVERVWTQLGEERLLLHRIYPCLKPYYHSHPWPSAVLLLKGTQGMAVGYGPPDEEGPPITANFHITPGTVYEMLDPYGWHAVNPLDGPSLSLMLTGKPWSPTAPKDGRGAVNRPLSDQVRDEILAEFLSLLPAS